MVYSIVVLGIVLDQLLKLYVHSHFQLGEGRELCSWFWLCYIENNGIAFGIEWLPKIVLTLFRLVAVGLLGWYIHALMKNEKTRRGYLAMTTLVVTGAMGNLIDCLFYGVIWDYAPLCYGRVVDMLYFPLIRNGAGDVLFFRPVFNLADSCITVAVFVIILFYRKDLDESLKFKV